MSYETPRWKWEALSEREFPALFDYLPPGETLTKVGAVKQRLGG